MSYKLGLSRGEGEGALLLHKPCSSHSLDLTRWASTCYIPGIVM